MATLAQLLVDVADLFDALLERGQELSDGGKVELYEQMLDQVAETNQRLLEVLMCPPTERLAAYTRWSRSS